MSKTKDPKGKKVSTRDDQAQTHKPTPSVAVQLVPIGQLKANPSNPRIMRDERFAKLKKSITEFPDMLNKRPIVAVTDKDGKLMVLGGNMRLRACQDLKMKTVPVVLADDWTEEQRRRFIIADNVGFGEHDWDMLANEWDAVELADWGLDLPEGGEEDVDVPLKFEDASLQVRPAMEYVLIMAEPNSEEWEDMKKVLGLKMVRRGGYKEGSAFDALGLERVLMFDDMKKRMEENGDRDTE
jgi:hypothetical protein